MFHLDPLFFQNTISVRTANVELQKYDANFQVVSVSIIEIIRMPTQVLSTDRESITNDRWILNCIALVESTVEGGCNTAQMEDMESGEMTDSFLWVSETSLQKLLTSNSLLGPEPFYIFKKALSGSLQTFPLDIFSDLCIQDNDNCRIKPDSLSPSNFDEKEAENSLKSRVSIEFSASASNAMQNQTSNLDGTQSFEQAMQNADQSKKEMVFSKERSFNSMRIAGVSEKISTTIQEKLLQTCGILESENTFLKKLFYDFSFPSCALSMDMFSHRLLPSVFAVKNDETGTDYFRCKLNYSLTIYS